MEKSTENKDSIEELVINKKNRRKKPEYLRLNETRNLPIKNIKTIFEIKDLGNGYTQVTNTLTGVSKVYKNFTRTDLKCSRFESYSAENEDGEEVYVAIEQGKETEIQKGDLMGIWRFMCDVLPQAFIGIGSDGSIDIKPKILAIMEEKIKVYKERFIEEKTTEMLNKKQSMQGAMMVDISKQKNDFIEFKKEQITQIIDKMKLLEFKSKISELSIGLALKKKENSFKKSVNTEKIIQRM